MYFTVVKAPDVKYLEVVSVNVSSSPSESQGLLLLLSDCSTAPLHSPALQWPHPTLPVSCGGDHTRQHCPVSVQSQPRGESGGARLASPDFRPARQQRQISRQNTSDLSSALLSILAGRLPSVRGQDMFAEIPAGLVCPELLASGSFITRVFISLSRLAGREKVITDWVVSSLC